MSARQMRLLAAVALIAAGCSTLRVEVDVASPTALAEWNSDRLLSKNLARVTAEPLGAMRARVDALRLAKRNAFLDKHSAEYENLDHSERQAAIDQLEKAFDKTTGRFYDYHADVLEKLGAQIREEAADTAKCEESFRKYANETSKTKIRPTCNQSRAHLVAMLQERETLFADVERGPDFVVVEQPGPLTSLIGQDGLFREPEAYTVASAPDDLWEKNFDRSFSWSLFGDTNVAIKMESRGNFSIKGVSFDPSEVTRVASKVVTQSLLAWTQIAGVPVTAAARRPGSIPVVMAENEQERLLFESENNDQWRALLSVADAVGGAKDRFGDNTRANTIKSLVAIWEANKERVLHPEPTAAGSRLTLAPAETTVAPSETFKLFPAIAAASERTINVALTVNEPVIADFPKFVPITAGQKLAQVDAVVVATAPWKDYTVVATLEQESEPMTVHVAPKFDLSGLPEKLLVNVPLLVERVVANEPPAGSAEPQPEAKGDLVAADRKFENKKLIFKVTGTKEGSGTIAIVTGNARSEAKTIAVVAPLVTASDVSVMQGESVDATIQLDRKGGVGDFKTEVTASEDDLTLTGAPTDWLANDTSKTFSITGKSVGTHTVTVKHPSGEPVTFKVVVNPPSVQPTPTTIEVQVGAAQELKLTSAKLKTASKVTVVVVDPTMATVDKGEIDLPASGGEAKVVITGVKEGSTEIVIEKDGIIAPLRIPVTITAAPNGT